MFSRMSSKRWAGIPGDTEQIRFSGLEYALFHGPFLDQIDRTAEQGGKPNLETGDIEKRYPATGVEGGEEVDVRVGAPLSSGG